MKANGVDRICAVQVSGFYGFDNRFICDASKAHPDWIAGICTLDPNDPHSPGLLEQYVRDYGIRGLRSVPGRGSDGRQLDHPGVRALWKTALDNGITVNLQIGYEHAGEADRLLGEFPDLPVALDHTLRMQADGPVAETLAALRILGRRKNCHTKMSFIANGPRGCQDGYPCRSFHKVVMEVVDIFVPSAAPGERTSRSRSTRLRLPTPRLCGSIRKNCRCELRRGRPSWAARRTSSTSLLDRSARATRAPRSRQRKHPPPSRIRSCANQ